MDDVESVETMREGVKRLKAGKEGVTAKAVSFDGWVDEYMEEIEAESDSTPTDRIEGRDGQTVQVIHGLLGDHGQKRGNKAIAFEDVDSKFLADWKRWRADDIKVGNRVVKAQTVVRQTTSRPSKCG